MPDDLARYYREAGALIRKIEESVDPEAKLFITPFGSPIIGTHAKGNFRRSSFYLEFREQLNWNPERGAVDKDYRYRLIYKGEELLRIETGEGQPEHMHFPKWFLSGTGHHFDYDRWPDELKDIDFMKVFAYYLAIEQNNYELLEPLKSARPLSRFKP